MMISKDIYEPMSVYRIISNPAFPPAGLIPSDSVFAVTAYIRQDTYDSQFSNRVFPLDEVHRGGTPTDAYRQQVFFNSKKRDRDTGGKEKRTSKINRLEVDVLA